MAAVDTWTWDEDSFLRAVDAGVFGDQRVELVEHEVWPVTIGLWHGVVAGNVVRLLYRPDWRVAMATLLASGSLPDPDAWMYRRDAQPVRRLGNKLRLAQFAPDDVALVVEVADTSFAADTTIKTRVYGSAGYQQYWVVHRGGVEVFTAPQSSGYAQQVHVEPGGVVTMPRTGAEIAVADLLDADDG